jgi:PAS domain S-box-containing protein
MSAQTEGRVVLHVAGSDGSNLDLTGLGDDDLTVRSASLSAAADRLAATDAAGVVAEFDDPGGAGIAFVERVRAARDSLPVVLCGPDEDGRTADAALAAGASEFVRLVPGTDRSAVARRRVASVLDCDRVERAAAEDRRRLSWFVEQSPLGVVEWRDGMVVERANGAAADILGYEPDELPGTRWTDLLDDASDAAAGRPGDAGTCHCVTAVRTGDGRRVVCEWYNRGVADDAADDVAVVSQFQDVTERRERERTLQQLHGVSRDLLSADTKQEVADGIIEAVRDTLGYDNNAVRFVDDDGCRLHPVAMTRGIAEVLGERPVYRVGEGTAGRAFAAGETLLYDDVQTIDDEYDRGEARAGMYLPIGTHGTLSINDSRPGAFDETDVQLAEVFALNAAAALDRIERTRRLERQNERLDQFARVVSHDLQNPLNVAMGRVGMAREQCDCGEDDDHLDAVAHAHERMRTLIRDLLSLARDGDPPTELESVSLAGAVDDCWRTVETAAATLTVEGDRTVRADRSRLQQLLENLFRNAVEHAGDDVTISVGPTEDGRGFYVADDGPGMSPAARRRAFEAGYSTSDGGTGLGLSIVETIADTHGWTVDVSESDAGGTRFEFTGVTVEDP